MRETQMWWFLLRPKGSYRTGKRREFGRDFGDRLQNGAN